MNNKYCQSVIDKKLDTIAWHSLELEDIYGKPIIINKKLNSVENIIERLLQTKDNLLNRKESLNVHQIHALNILKEVKKSGLNYSCCLCTNQAEYVYYEKEGNIE